MADTELEERPAQDPTKVPRKVDERIDRGRKQMLKGAAKRRMFYRFWRGDTYAYVNGKGLLMSENTLAFRHGGQMPDHRIRNRYPFIASIVQTKVSTATQRVPGYEVLPSTTEPDDAQAAELGSKVAIYGYDMWRLRRARVKWCEHAFVGGEGFLYPYFDTSIGPFTETQDGWIGEGEVRVRVLSANEVYWEPGEDFEDSRWYVIEQARPKDVVKDMPGFIETREQLTSDATDSEDPREDRPDDLVLTREYLERPCPDYPHGRKLTIANGRLIVPEEPYPVIDHKNRVLDEPPMFRLSYIAETDDRDRGLVELSVDLVRTIQDSWNKILEWKNRALNPQMTAPRGSNMARRDDTPGATWFYTPVGGQKPEWEKPPQIPRELFEILGVALDHLRIITADIDVQADPDLAGKTANAAIESSREKWATFLADLAEQDGRVARRCLQLVQRHYTEPRLVKIMGTWGPDLTPGFMGADLNGQADVRVSPESLAVKSRKQVVEEATLYLDRQIITPHAYMQAISTGNVEVLNRAYLSDFGRANMLIQKIKQGPEAIHSLRPNKPPPGFALPPMQPPMWDGVPPGMVPGWMPRQFDNVDIQIEVFETWMKTADWERLPDDQREVAEQIYAALTGIRTQRMIEQQVQQDQMAQALGQANAGKPQQAAPTPDQRQLATGSNGSQQQ